MTRERRGGNPGAQISGEPIEDNGSAPKRAGI